jgi:hypothetical protein
MVQIARNEIAIAFGSIAPEAHPDSATTSLGKLK